MKRRIVISAAGGVTFGAALPVLGQTPQKVYRIGVLTRGLPRAYFQLPLALRKFGYEEGKNIDFDYRSAEGQEDRIPALAADLVAKNVDLIVALVNVDILAAKRASSTIPIVMLYSLVPVESGLVPSLAHPGGNVTGTTIHAPEIAGKMIQLLREVEPRVGRIALLVESKSPPIQPYMQASIGAASRLRVQLQMMPGNTLAEIEMSLATMERDRPDALCAALSGQLTTHRARVIEFAAMHRLPALYTDKAAVAEGGLMCYSYNGDEILERAAAIVDRVLRGTKPADIPVEQPTRFDLVINMRTAKAMNFTIPRLVRFQATEVIE